MLLLEPQKTDYTCGVACISYILQLSGVYGVTQEGLLPMSGCDKDGMRDYQVCKLLRLYKKKCRSIFIPKKNIIKNLKKILIKYKFIIVKTWLPKEKLFHYIILYKINGKYFSILDPGNFGKNVYRRLAYETFLYYLKSYVEVILIK